jgi:hypothetical protein
VIGALSGGGLNEAMTEAFARHAAREFLRSEGVDQESGNEAYARGVSFMAKLNSLIGDQPNLFLSAYLDRDMTAVAEEIDSRLSFLKPELLKLGMHEGEYILEFMMRRTEEQLDRGFMTEYYKPGEEVPSYMPMDEWLNQTNKELRFSKALVSPDSFLDANLDLILRMAKTAGREIPIDIPSSQKDQMLKAP